MEDVTDTVFREVVAQHTAHGNLHVVFTEFMSVDGFLHEKGREKVAQRLIVSDSERKILAEKNIRLVVQIWGNDPEKFYKAAKDIATNYRFDGIDINMGCPVKKVVKNNACSALINFPDLAKEIMQATMEGSDLPVSVKTRIGFKSVATESWISSLLEVKPAAITVHGRTQKMQSEGLADWKEIARAVSLRDQLSHETRILGNGDVMSWQDGADRFRTYGVDGTMIGRGIFHNPGFFSARNGLNDEDRIAMLLQHLERFRDTWGRSKNYAILKRFFKIYVHSFDGAGALRARLMESKDCDEGIAIVHDYFPEI